VPQLFLLSHLIKHGETTYYSLSRDLPYNSKYILKVIKALEADSLIHREKVGNKKLINITSAGREMFKEINKERSSFFQAFNDSGITWEELINFYSVMEKINSTFLKK